MNLRELEKNGQYDILVNEVKKLIQEDKRNLSDPLVKNWCGKRWRNLFLNQVAQDEQAIQEVSKHGLFSKNDKPLKQKLALRFLKGDGPDEWSIDMPEVKDPEIKNTTLVFCPGLLTGLFPVLAFQSVFPTIHERFKIRIVQSDSHPVRSCKENTADVLNAIELGIGLNERSELVKESNPPGNIIIIAYSKGMPDTLQTLMDKPEIKNRIKAIVNWAGAPGGSYLANAMYESLKNFELPIKEDIENVLKLISPVISMPKQLKRLGEYNIKGALGDLTTYKRGEFLDKYLYDIDAMNIPIFNISGSTTAMEVPFFQIQGVMELNKYDANNDMQVTQKQARIQCPMATDLAMLHAHHWDMSYDPFPEKMRFGSPNLDHRFPRTSAIAAVIQFLYELGLID